MLHKITILSITLVLFLCFFNTSVRCANILAMVPYSARSHFNIFEPLLKGLAKRGHNVTVISCFPTEEKIPNYEDIDVSNIVPLYSGVVTLDIIKKQMSSVFQTCNVFWNIGETLCDNLYKDVRLQNLINTTVKYDLLINQLFSTDCLLPFAHVWDIPVVSVVTSVALPWTNDRIGNPDNPSYIPNYFLSYNDKMSFFERLWNTATLLYAKIWNHYEADKKQFKMIQNYFGNNLPPLEEIASQKTSLVLVNSYYTVNQPRPLVPNFIEIGGIHLKAPKALPQDLKNILDEAKNGFIFFSFGSMMKGSALGQKEIEIFLKAFSKLPQLVLWKFEEELPNLPSNVLTRKWWPQNDILVHKNIKIFISHGGLSSTIEAVNAGVPMLGIPMFADQSGNVNNIVKKGAGLLLNYGDITYEKVRNALNKITNDRSFMENAKKMSLQFKDRPLPPLENALFWIEYVLRHKGAYHMRSEAVNLPLHKYLLLDVALFILFIVILIILFSYIGIRYIYRSFINKCNVQIKYNFNKKYN